MTDMERTAARLDAFGRLRAALVSAIDGGGVGCHHWTRPMYGAPVAQLEVFGLVKVIKTRVPLCEQHGCPAIATCEERAAFAAKKGGIGNFKFRLTALGGQAISEWGVLARQVAAQPLAGAILAELVASSASAPATWLDLYWRLLQPELTMIEETGQRPALPLSRIAVRLYLDLLIAAGLVAEDAAAGTVWLSRQPHRGWRPQGDSNP